MNYSSEARKIYSQLKLKELFKEGIEKEELKTTSHSHIIVTYPPLKALEKIEESEIFVNENLKLREIALYIHIPFCTGKCLYCPYATLVHPKEEIVEGYIDCLEKEIKLLLQKKELKNIILNSIYLGGGTPTYLTNKQLEKVFKIIRENFKIKKDTEITVEAEPDTLIANDGEEKLNLLLNKGVNRLSIGFQTFDNKILKIIGRRHTNTEAIEAYNLAKKNGFKNINIDLISGLPKQTLEIWENDLKQALKLKPNSITCYPFYLKENTGLWLLSKKDSNLIPKKEEAILMNILTQKFFKENQFTERPIRWFTKSSKYMYKQQLFKWEEIGEQLAIGSSAYSFINNVQYFNVNNIQEYITRIQNNHLPIDKGIKLNKEDLMRRMIIFGLKSQLDKTIFNNKFGVFPKEAFREIWAKLERLNLIKDEGSIIILSDLGRIFADEVAKEFFNEKIK
jgi:oxygen-independent coproporphyrinogen-3 oxidase